MFEKAGKEFHYSLAPPSYAKAGVGGLTHVPLMIGIGVSHNHGIPAFEGNLVACVQADGNGNMSFALIS